MHVSLKYLRFVNKILISKVMYYFLKHRLFNWQHKSFQTPLRILVLNIIFIYETFMSIRVNISGPKFIFECPLRPTLNFNEQILFLTKLKKKLSRSDFTRSSDWIRVKGKGRINSIVFFMEGKEKFFVIELYEVHIKWSW